MAKDVDIAIALSDMVSGHSFSRDFGCEFLFDQYVANERVESIMVRLSVERDKRYRQHRTAWCRNAVLSAVIIAPQQVNRNAVHDANSEIVSLMDLWDEILDFIQDQTPNGNSPIAIESFDDSRFDKDKLHSDRQFRAGVAITYLLI